MYLFPTFTSKSTLFPSSPSPFSSPLLLYNQLHPIIAAMIHMGMGHPLGHGQPTKDNTHKENWLLLSQQPSTFNSSSAESELLPCLCWNAISLLSNGPVQAIALCCSSGKWLCHVQKTLVCTSPSQFLDFTTYFLPHFYDAPWDFLKKNCDIRDNNSVVSFCTLAGLNLWINYCENRLLW